MNCTNHRYVWDPWKYFYPKNPDSSYAILILNKCIKFPFEAKILMEMWNKASVRITVDGGTETWKEWVCNNQFSNAANIDLLTGDMDSISPKTLQFYENCKTTKVVRTMDQDRTDFTKALMELKIFLKEKNIPIDTLIVLDDSSGRFDQIMANINTLFLARTIVPTLKIIKVANDSFTWLLTEGEHLIHVPESIYKSGEWCSLVPIGHPCVVTTTGLKWNLNSTKMAFGQLVSTSNTYSGESTVYVKTDNVLVWSMCVKSLFQNS